MAPGIPNPAHILLAQAESPNGLLLAGHLLREKFCLSLRSDGTGLLQELPTLSVPHICIIDLNLPNHTGMPLLQLAKTLPGWAQTPVILLSEGPQESHEILAFRMGASDFVTKPIKFDPFLARIRRRLSAC
ncbi:response regulator [Acidithiobacillus thiooxidans]|uniref:response regulator n=1 Tax=Acidithiobacillus thiooxidans TaxID=930 RepID=UPI000691D8EA|nr:response regulator [Acidithiobacillus thiooxidans]